MPSFVNIKCLNDEHFSGSQAVSNSDKETLHSAFSFHKDTQFSGSGGKGETKHKISKSNRIKYSRHIRLTVFPTNLGAGTIILSR